IEFPVDVPQLYDNGSTPEILVMATLPSCPSGQLTGVDTMSMLLILATLTVMFAVSLHPCALVTITE
ncbi:MAG: hypothetical protein GYA62_14460, partial [Bacteroidales bacterium]|nr:hypothetical protein [Bacteroidales bacterium]